jgi:hypothetical protein
MAWSFRLFDVAGTAVRIHFTFFLLLVWIGAAHWMRGGYAEAIDGLGRMFSPLLPWIGTFSVADPNVVEVPEGCMAGAASTTCSSSGTR